VGASSAEIRARLEATRQRLDQNLDDLLKELAPNEAVARYLRRPVTIALVGAGVVLALALPKTPPERLLKRKRRQRKAEQQPEPEPGKAEKAKRAVSLLESLPPRLLRGLADAGVATVLAKRWLDRRRPRSEGHNLPRLLDEGLSRISLDGHRLPDWLERVLPAKLSVDERSKRRGVLRFLR
jgi:hypothetical protein